MLSGCGDSERPSKPDNLIPKEKMSDILYDAFLLNAAKGINRNVLEINGVLPEAYVYKKYSIDSTQFALSNAYYAYDIEVYKGIMEQVKLKIEIAKKINDSISLEETKQKGSLSKVSKPTIMLDSAVSLKPTSDSILKAKPKLEPNVFGKDND